MTPRRLIEPARLAGGPLLRTQSDERLVDLTRAGNDRAFEAIVHRYRRPLLRYCSRLLPAQRAEDAVQQAFVSAYSAMCSNEAELKLRPWLYKIAHNASLNLLRQNGWDHDEIDETVRATEGPEHAFERRERLTRVLAAVGTLPERQRDAVILRELEGRSYEEIATELHVSGGAVRQLLNRARTTLRSAATAVMPPELLIRLGSGATEGSMPQRIAEACAGSGGAAALAKLGAAVVVAGAVAGSATNAPVPVIGSGDGGQTAEAEAAPGSDGAPLGETGSGARGAEGDATGSHHGGASGRGDSRGGDDRSGRGGGDGDADDVVLDSSGPGGGEREPTGDDHSGPGHGGGEDHSGPGGGETLAEHSGSGSSGSGGSGSGSSGPGPSGSDSSGSSGSGSDSSGSGSSGSGSDSGSISNSGPGSSSSGSGG